MSGIVGLFGEGSPEQNYRAVERMVAAVAHRGMSRYAKIPESSAVVAQLRHPAAFDGLHIAEQAIVGMAGRLDEPEDVARSLGLYDVPSDDVLVAHAYQRWGADFAEHVQGDYAIFIWDRGANRLLLLRDRFGVEPLFYAVIGSSVLFASEIKAIFSARPELRNPLREELVADYVAGVHAADPEETIYRRIRRLPAASMAIVQGAEVTVRKYYSPDLTPRPLTKSAPEEFAECLSTAVRRRMRTSGRVGALLSGGLDSSTITCLAAREGAAGHDLQTITASFEADPNSEDAFAAAVRQKAGLTNALYINGDEAAIFGNSLATSLHEMDRPPYGPNNTLTRHVAHAAASAGAPPLVLCGHGGDEIVSSGSPFLRELAEQGQWLRLWNELGDTRALGQSRVGLLATLFLRGSAIGRKATRMGRMLRIGQSVPASTSPWTQRVSSDIARSPTFQDRYGRRRAPPVAEQLPFSGRSHASVVLDPFQVELLEDLDHTRAASGILFRFPFWDKDVIELAVSLPGEEKWSRGWPRTLLRRAMNHTLPAEVAWRRGKYDFAPRFRTFLRDPDAFATMSRALFEDADAVSPYVNVGQARLLLQSFAREENEVSIEDLFYLWRVTVLSRWLIGGEA